MREVSRVRSTKRKPFERNPKLKGPIGKEQIRRKKLNPHYVAGFIDGEGSFSISIGKHKTTKSGFDVRPEFEIEVRKDDQVILERILVTIGCGKIFDCSYDRYGWYPHAKYKITSNKDMREYLFPFLDACPLQAKNLESYKLFKKIVLMMLQKKHLTKKGLEEIRRVRDKMRTLGKKARTYGNR
ncbi:MAG: LAGLIDADG family homing endonuclease [Candidatus Pacebacteria bacterium]|nr:LAGLIDADG family homing endonuclease [Candidatus Paceibacterota bacterium]